MTVGTSVGGTFSYMSPFTSVTRCCSVAAGTGNLEDGGTGDGNNRDQKGVRGDLGDQRCCWRWGKEVVQGWMRVWEGAEFWAWCKVVQFGRLAWSRA